VASNRRHAREKLVSVCADDRHEKRRIQVLHDVYDAHLRGVRLPIAPRRIITWAWDRAQALKLNPERGAPVPLIDENELADRRERSPLAGDGAWVLRRMAELATDTGTMSVVTDSDGVVLWRDGDRTVMAKADNARFTLRAKWDFSTAGPGGIALALLRRTMVTVCRFEHYVQTQHDLSCVATSVRDPRDGRQWILNLTGTRSSIHPAVLRELDTIALRWKRQLAAGPDPACRAFT
jgi:transcriptional regulator of acetoin/glycerol metabolism